MKFRLHKYILLFTAIFSILLILAGCSISSVPAGSAEDAEIDYGKSEIYSQKDMDAAIEIIKAEFSTWKGCTLQKIYYVSENGKEYKNWQWWLGRSETGDWKLMTWGY